MARVWVVMIAVLLVGWGIVAAQDEERRRISRFITAL